MAFSALVEKVIGRDGSDNLKLYECRECGSWFETTQTGTFVNCPECHSKEVTPLQTVESHT